MNQAWPSWSEVWRDVLGVPAAMPQGVLAALLLGLLFFVVVVPAAAVMSYLDRKLSADFQARVGPAYSGPAGMLQPLADFLKLLQKAGPPRPKARESLWLVVYIMVLYSTLAALPLGSSLLLVDTDMSAFVPFWAALMLGLVALLLGLAQGTVPGWLSGFRIAAQALAGAFPALVCLLCAGVRAGSFRWSALAEAQGASPLNWTALSNPFQFVAFAVFVVSGLVLLGIPPLDGGLSESDILGGVVARLSGFRLTLFRLGRFYAFFLWSVVSVVLFLGGWVLPEGITSALREGGAWVSLGALELSWLMLKTLSVMVLVIWVARVNPRSRVDQITDLSWRVLSPFSLAALIGSCLWAGWRAVG